MRNSIRLIFAFAIALWAGSAAADVNAYATVYKDKDVYVSVDIDINKDVTIDVTYDADLAGAAEADTIVNQVNEYNVSNASQRLSGPSGPSGGTGPANWPLFGTPHLISLDADITNSINSNSGIVGVNQDVGANTNQGNVVSFTLSDSESVFSDTQAAMDQKNRYNRAVQYECSPTQGCDFDRPEGSPETGDPTRNAEINDSVNFNAGVVGVNQNAGNNNNQANALATSVGFNTHVALSESMLGQENHGNSIIGVNTVKLDLISGSILGNSGVVGVNQTTGNNNNQGANVAFGALVSPAQFSVPGSQPLD